jgi:hypothetical protein
MIDSGILDIHSPFWKEERDRVIRLANCALNIEPVGISSYICPYSNGNPNDYYSDADYWWPDITTNTGFPYVRRDGFINPNNFNSHRILLRKINNGIAALAAAYKFTNENTYVKKACELLDVFFIRSESKMNSHGEYSQNIRGQDDQERAMGIIDTIHLIETPLSINILKTSPYFSYSLYSGLSDWFTNYLQWLGLSSKGQKCSEWRNNHASSFYLQRLIFSMVSNIPNGIKVYAINKLKEKFISKHMSTHGFFPKETQRTRSYNYSLFQLEIVSLLCYLLTDNNENMWTFECSERKNIKIAIDAIIPYLQDKNKWPLGPDLGYWDELPSRRMFPFLAGMAYNDQNYIDIWKQMIPDPKDQEISRNIIVTQPLLWLDLKN